MRRVLAVLTAAFIFSFGVVNASCDEIEMIKGHATAYCQTGITASGEYTHDGICAMNRKLLGKTVIVYQRLPNDEIGELIGIFDVKDTGGTKGLKNGSVVDVWKPNLDECKEFMNLVYEDGCKGRVYIQIVEDEVDG